MINSDYLKKFINYQLSIGNSTHTIDYYYYCINPFLDFLGSCSIVDITKQILNDYSLSLRGRNISSVSKRSYSKGLKVFLSWLFNENYINHDISLFFKLPKQQAKIIDILSDNEINLLFSSFNTTTHDGLRNYIICALMYDCGLRKSEVININYKDIRLKDRLLIINGKGNKQRKIPIGATLSIQIQEYIKIYGYNYLGCFLQTKNNTSIQQGTIDKLMKNLKTQLNIPRIHSHLLRHTFATHYLINGGNISSLQPLKQ